MKNISILLLSITISLISLTAFANDNTRFSNAQGTTNPLPVFTYEELAKFNGKNGNKAYVAVDGTVYDVTNNKYFTDGVHNDTITAGADRSLEINSSPHKKEVLKNLPVVGIMK